MKSASKCELEANGRPSAFSPLGEATAHLRVSGALHATGILLLAVFLCHRTSGQPTHSPKGLADGLFSGVGSNSSAVLTVASSLTRPGSYPTNLEYLLEMGSTYYATGAYRQAVGLFSNAAFTSPTNFMANLQLGRTYYRLGDYGAAITALKTASHSNSNEFTVHFAMGKALFRLGRYQEAAAAYKQALPLATNQAAVWFNLGWCQYSQHDLTRAVQSLQQCVLKQPTNYDGYLMLGSSLFQLGRIEESAVAFGEAAKLRPQNFEANQIRGMNLMLLLRFKEAAPALAKALEIRPSERDLRWLLLVCYIATGQENKIPQLDLVLFAPFMILMLGIYLIMACLLFRKSLRPDSRSFPTLRFTLAWSGVAWFGEYTLWFVGLCVLSWTSMQSIGVGTGLSALPLIAAAIMGFAHQPWGKPFTWSTNIPRLKWLLLIFGALSGLWLFENGYDWLVQRITGKPMPDQLFVSVFRGSLRNSFWLSCLGFVVAAPAVEEILFRGLLYGALEKWLSPSWTIILSAAIFSIAHMELIYFVPLFAMGLILGWARRGTGGLGLPVAIHCLNNGIGVLTILSP